MATQFQKTLSQVLKNKTTKVKAILAKTTKENADDCVELLRRQSTRSGAYKAGQAIGVYADKRSKRSAGKWRAIKNSRASVNSISYIFRNEAVAPHNKYPYVNSIYGEYDGKAFRSKKLSEARWEGFKRFCLKALAGKAKYDINKGDTF